MKTTLMTLLAACVTLLCAAGETETKWMKPAAFALTQPDTVEIGLKPDGTVVWRDKEADKWRFKEGDIFYDTSWKAHYTLIAVDGELLCYKVTWIGGSRSEFIKKSEAKLKFSNKRFEFWLDGKDPEMQAAIFKPILVESKWMTNVVNVQKIGE